MHGLCIVALSGVWYWMHTNSGGGKMALPGFCDITLNGGRRVIIGLDGDQARKCDSDKIQGGSARTAKASSATA